MRTKRITIGALSLAVAALAAVGITAASASTTGIPPAPGTTATYTVTGSSTPYAP